LRFVKPSFDPSFDLASARRLRHSPAMPPRRRAEEADLLPVSGANAPEITVSELANALKRTVEERFGLVRVRGEIGGYRGPHASGHAYFTLKDENARLDAVIWKGAFLKLKTKPQEGLEVVATGRLTTFPGKSTYQIVIESLELAGVGALMALLDERRKRLAAEGLFGAERKRALPFLPAVIGVVTSPTGAVIRDILHRLEERFPRHVLVWPVRVQGEGSAAEVAAAIEGFNAIAGDGPIPRPDILIVARGGGSLEDLWGFNEEIVVRAAAASTIPLISAVGHETDTTLIDFVSDLRAPTPTAAAEKAVPVRLELLESTTGLARRLLAAMRRSANDKRQRLAGLGRHLSAPERALAGPRQRLDLWSERLRGGARAGLDRRRLRLARASQALARQSPQARLERDKERLRGLGARLNQGLRARAALAAKENEYAKRRLAAAAAQIERVARLKLAERRERLQQLEKLRNSLGHEAVLARGFALVRDASGAIVRSAGAVDPGNAEMIVPGRRQGKKQQG